MAGVKVVLDGYTFDSKLEAEIYALLKAHTKIKIVAVHQTFDLFEPFDWFDFKRQKKGKIRDISYTPDFIVELEGNPKRLAVEVKGFQRSDYMLRKKLFIYKYKEEYDFVQINDASEAREVFGAYR
jgi:hypothetical protein